MTKEEISHNNLGFLRFSNEIAVFQQKSNGCSCIFEEEKAEEGKA